RTPGGPVRMPPLAAPVRVLSAAEAAAARRAHQERADALTAAHRERRARGEKHAVEDFLFTYYPFSAARLRRWHPGWELAYDPADRKSTRLNSSHVSISYAVFCLN